MSTLPQDIAAWRAHRNAVLTSLDMTEARKTMDAISEMRGGAKPGDEVVLMSLHKARYDCLDIDRALRLESAEWLRERGLKGLTGPLLPPGELPEGSR